MSWNVHCDIYEPCEVFPHTFALFLLSSYNRVRISFVLLQLHEVGEKHILKLGLVVDVAWTKCFEPCSYIPVKGCREICAPKHFVKL